MAELTLGDMVDAYHSAKVDLYYASDSRLIDLLEYEENLIAHLESLLERVNRDDERWILDSAFLGTYSLAPTSIDPLSNASSDGFYWSDHASAWHQTVVDAGENRPMAEFRVMSLCSIDMHVLSTLWMQTAGGRLEAALGPEAMGNRLKRTASGDVNTRAPASFVHYYAPYARWRDRGLAAMTDSLRSGTAVIALTADISAFYHNLDPAFLLNVDYTAGVLGVSLTKTEQKLNRLFVNGLQAWTDRVASEGNWLSRGIPVGLPASAVVANLALVELDRMVLAEVKPIYYGRYVDDVILVLKDGRPFDSQRSVWEWLIKRANGLLREAKPNKAEANRISVRFTTNYLESSEVIFSSIKNKAFHLQGEPGLALVGSIRKTIDERASEWRSFTPVHSNADEVGTDLAVATQVDGENAATLRDADQISTRRSAFAIRLRDFEAYERDLDLNSWADQRSAFFDAVCRNVIVLPKFFELARYFPRIVRLAAACGDLIALTHVFESAASAYNSALEDCRLSIKAYAQIEADRGIVAARWAHQLVRQSIDSLASGLAGKVTSADLTGAIRPLESLANAVGIQLPGVQRLRRLYGELFARDLAHVPYRFAILGSEIAPQRGLPQTRHFPAEILTGLPRDRVVRDGLNLLVDSLRATEGGPSIGLPSVEGSVVAGLALATRPPNVLELFLALRGDGSQAFGFASAATIQKILAAVRGYPAVPDLPEITSVEGYPTLSVGGVEHNGRVRFALAMVDTSMGALARAALGAPDLGRVRYESFKRVLNEATARPGGANYLVLPELSLPSRWFVPFAKKLQLQGVNFIAGIEYLAAGDRRVHNQVWTALRSKGQSGLSYVVYPQDKQRAAPNEEPWLTELGQLTLVPRVAWGHPGPPVIAHGEFRFALLVCSELTNIQYRSELRGRVDALVIPEWNQDLHTFESLVESAALDVHAYVIQVNRRRHGDTRIRAPHSKEYLRDVVRLRGGTHDYVVIGEIDYGALREHHSVHRNPKGAFKPLPDGFSIADERKRSPQDKESS